MKGGMLQIDCNDDRTIFLPRCEGKPYEFALGIINNQKIEDSEWRLNLCIVDESYKFVRRESFRLNYRFSSEVMRTCKPKTTTDTG